MMHSPLARFLKLYLLEVSLLWLAFAAYALVPFGQLEYTRETGFYFGAGITVDTLFWLSCAYSVVAIYLIARKARAGESTKLATLLEQLRTRSFDRSFTYATLFYLIKIIRVPVLIATVVLYFTYVWDALGSPPPYSSAIGFFNSFLFPLLLNCFILIGSTYYTFGYLVESERLGNKVKSVDTTLTGWAVTLICYAPLFVLARQVVYFPTRDLAFIVNDEITFTIRIAIVLLIVFKVWSWTVLGAKCSFMTNRGIVTSGPFKVIRHPHYSVKLIVWWLTLYPAVVKDARAIIAMVLWTAIYILRALTEERHLKADPDYVDYCNKVRWRFVPFVF
jgi:protein-S-isoprenylcysteine O-methyltransferase Ste14